MVIIIAMFGAGYIGGGHPGRRGVQGESQANDPTSSPEGATRCSSLECGDQREQESEIGSLRVCLLREDVAQGRPDRHA